jgi:hypothetical protein
MNNKNMAVFISNSPYNGDVSCDRHSKQVITFILDVTDTVVIFIPVANYCS